MRRPASLEVFSLRVLSLALIALLTMVLPAAADELTFDALFDEDTDGRLASQLEWRPGSAELRMTWGQRRWGKNDDDGRGQGDPPRLDRFRDLAGESGHDAEGVHFLPKGDALLYSLGGDLYRYALDGGEITRLTETEGDEEMVEMSPDGTHLSYVRDNDLYVLPLDGGKEQRLTDDGLAEVIFNGITDWVYWEEIWGRDSTGSWWNGDASALAYYHIDDREVTVYPLVDTSTAVPTVQQQRYPKSGTTVPKVEIRVAHPRRRQGRQDGDPRHRRRPRRLLGPGVLASRQSTPRGAAPEP